MLELCTGLPQCLKCFLCFWQSPLSITLIWDISWTKEILKHSVICGLIYFLAILIPKAAWSKNDMKCNKAAVGPTAVGSLGPWERRSFAVWPNTSWGVYRRHSQWSSGALFLSSEREGAHWCTLLILKKPGITRMWCKPQYPFALLWGRKELVSWRSPSEMGKGCRRGRGYLPDPCLGTCCEAPHAVWLKVRERQTTSVHTTSHDSLEAFLATTAMKSNAPQQK